MQVQERPKSYWEKNVLTSRRFLLFSTVIVKKKTKIYYKQRRYFFSYFINRMNSMHYFVFFLSTYSCRCGIPPVLVTRIMEKIRFHTAPKQLLKTKCLISEGVGAGVGRSIFGIYHIVAHIHKFTLTSTFTPLDTHTH